MTFLHTEHGRARFEKALGNALAGRGSKAAYPTSVGSHAYLEKGRHAARATRMVIEE